MNLLQSTKGRSITQTPLGTMASIAIPSLSASAESQTIQRSLISLTTPSPTFIGSRKPQSETLEERLFDARATFKILTSQIAMHLDSPWRRRLFGQLDELLSRDDWESDDVPPSISSFRTFLRLILLLKPTVRPGLGATFDGHLIAAWTSGANKLTIECYPADIVRLSIARDVDDFRERLVSETALARLPEVLGPYNPDTWFGRAEQLSPV